MKKTCSVPITIHATGEEVTAQGTIHFDPTRLAISEVAGDANTDVKLGTKVVKGARVLVKPGDIRAGRIGFVVEFNGQGASPAVKAKPGKYTLLTLRFKVLTDDVGETAVTWSDEVFLTKTGGDVGQALSIAPVNGSVEVGKKLKVTGLVLK